MSTEVIVALVGLATAFITTALGVASAYITAHFTVKRQVGELAIKVDVLWAIYVEDAVAEARRENLARRNSPLVMGPRWHSVVPSDLDEEVRSEIDTYISEYYSSYDAALAIFYKHRARLLEIANRHGIKPQALIGAIYLMCEERSEA